MNADDFYAHILSHERSLLTFARNLTANGENAKDLVQETFLRALLNKEKFNNENIKAWLFTILRNIYLNSVTKLSAKNTVSNILDNDEFLKNKWGHEETADTIIFANEISTTVSDLNKEYKIPLRMYIDGYKYKEIASETNLPIGTVKSRIFFARKIVSDKLKEPSIKSTK